MNKVDFALIHLDSTFEVNYPNYLDNYFNIPIEIQLKNKGLSSLYAWKNGNKIEALAKNNSYEFCSFGYFVPYELAVDFMENNKDYFEIGKRKLLPIIADLKGDFLLVDTADNSSPVFIVSPSLMITEPEEIFTSLDKMLYSIAICFEKKAYTFINNNLQIDYDLEKAIFKKYDSSKFWNEE